MVYIAYCSIVEKGEKVEKVEKVRKVEKEYNWDSEGTPCDKRHLLPYTLKALQLMAKSKNIKISGKSKKLLCSQIIYGLPSKERVTPFDKSLCMSGGRKSKKTPLMYSLKDLKEFAKELGIKSSGMKKLHLCAMIQWTLSLKKVKT
jgi:hypothetical protein